MSKYFTLLILTLSSLHISAKLMPHVPPSECLEGLKTLSTQEGWGRTGDGKSIILRENYTLNYGYDKKTKKYTPILTHIEGNNVIVVTPNGTSKTTGRSCYYQSKETSIEKIAEWISTSDENLAKMYAFSKTLKSGSQQKKTYVQSVKAHEAQYIGILEHCSQFDSGPIKDSAKKVLDRLSGTSSEKTSSKEKATR